MKGIVTLTFALCGAALFGAAPVGVPIAEIAVPVESITVSKDSVTVAEKDVSRIVPDKVPTLQELISIVRSTAPEKERISALDLIRDQETLFMLFFKPGEDRSIAVRKSALNRLAEVEVVKVLAEKLQIQELRDAALARIKTIYADERDFKPLGGSDVVRQYAKRMRRPR